MHSGTGTEFQESVGGGGCHVLFFLCIYARRQGSEPTMGTVAGCSRWRGDGSKSALGGPDTPPLGAFMERKGMPSLLSH